MKKLLYLLLITSSAALAQLPCLVPPASGIADADKFMFCNGSNSRSSTFSLFKAELKADLDQILDTAKVPYIYAGRSTGYVYFDGTRWISQTPAGSGTVNSGSQYRLGYYATTGTAISEAPAITGGRALVSDANGVPTHSATTATELGYVSGVTSAIQAQIDGKQTAFTSQNRKLFFKSPTNSSGVPAFLPTRKNDLDSLYDFKGLVINEDFNTAFANYTTAGSASWSIVSNMLQAVGGTTFTLSDYVRHSGWGSTCIGNWSAVAEVVVGTIGANTHGVGISFQSTASVNKSNHFVLRLNTANQGQLGSYIDNSTGLISGVDYSLLSTTNLTVAAGDRVRLRLDVIQNEYIFTVTNLTQTSVQPITITRTAVATGPTSYTNYNTGQFALNICGGTHSFDLHQVTINEVVGADVMFVGNSITRGAGASSKENSYPYLFQKQTNAKVAVWAGGGNRAADLIGADVARYSPSVVVIAAGVNDIIASRTNAQIVTDINAFITGLGAGYVLGTNVFISEVLPYSTSSAAIISLNSHLATTYGAANLIRNYKSFDNGSGGMKTELVTGDLLHPSDDGHRLIADLNYRFFLERGLIKPSFNPESGNTPAYKQAGYLALGKQTFTPSYPIHTLDPIYGIGIGGDASNTMYGGSINASSSSMVIQHGAYTNAAGTDAISTNATGNWQMNIANGNFNLRNKSGVALGSTVLPWNVRFNLNLAGNIQIGASNDDSWRVTSAGASSTMRFIVEGAGINSRTASGVTSIGLTEVGFHGFVSNATDRIRITAINTLAFSSTPGSEAGELAFFTKTTTASVAERMRITHTGNIGIGVIAPTAVLHLKAGTATASTAPLKLTTGTALTTPEDGAIEYHSSHLYFTIGSTRYQLDQQGGMTNPLTTTGDIIYSSSGSTPARRAIGSSNDYLKVTGGVPVWASFSTDVQAIGDARYQIKAFGTVGSNYTLTAADHTIFNAGSSTYTLTLPDATTMPGQQFELKLTRNATGSFILNTTAGQTVDGLASGAVTVTDYTKVESSGSNWFIVAPVRKDGSTTLTYDGVTTVFNIPHGLGFTPNSVPISARNYATHGGGAPIVTVDATNITITYAVAPSAGSNIIDWSASK